MRRLRALGIGLFLITGAAEARPLVAIIDSGIARTDELLPVLVAEYDMAQAPARPAFMPSVDHGTMVATILSRAANGGADIVSMRIDDPAGCPGAQTPPCQPSAAPIVAAIRKAVALRVRAINISLALKNDPAITAAIRDAADQGIAVVLAAGNNGLAHPGNLSMARAGYPRTVLVGALDASGAAWSGANRPEPIRWFDYNYVWCLGVDVPTTARDGQPVTVTGTSFAAPVETARLLVKGALLQPEASGFELALAGVSH